MKTLAAGRYRLERVLGEGAAAAVWQAFDTQLQVPRAIKVLHLERGQSASMRRRLRGEARAMAALQHPNVLRIFDIGTDLEHDVDYVVMDLATGGAISDVLRNQGPMRPDVALRYTVQVLSGLAAAHAVGIVHRDVKPQNILLDGGHNALIADFGIALLAEDDGRRTRTGVMMGSLPFMAPEQRLDARSVGPQADVYAMGATLYCLLTAANPVDLFAAKEDSPRWNGVPEEIRPIIRRAVAYAAEDRYADCRTMAMEVLEVLPSAGRLPVHVPSVTEPEFFPRPSEAFSRQIGVRPTAVPVTRGGDTEHDLSMAPEDASVHTAVEYLEELSHVDDGQLAQVRADYQAALAEAARADGVVAPTLDAPEPADETLLPGDAAGVGPTLLPDPDADSDAVVVLDPAWPDGQAPAAPRWPYVVGTLVILGLLAWLLWPLVSSPVPGGPSPVQPRAQGEVRVEPPSASGKPAVQAPRPADKPAPTRRVEGKVEETPPTDAVVDASTSSGAATRPSPPVAVAKAPVGRWRAYDGGDPTQQLVELRLQGGALRGRFLVMLPTSGRVGTELPLTGTWDAEARQGEVIVDGGRVRFDLIVEKADVMRSVRMISASGQKAVIWRRER